MLSCAEGMILKKYADKKWVSSINEFLESNSFIALLAILTVFSNVLGAEFFVYTLVISYGIYLCLLGRDMRSIAGTIPFMYLSPSVQNNPAWNPQSIFYPENGLWLIIAYLLLFLVFLTVRIALSIKRKIFVGKRVKLLCGFGFLGVGFLMGGVGQEEYTALNLRYGAVLLISLFLVYFSLILLVDWNTVRCDYFAWIGTFMGLIVTAELINIYLQGNAISATGRIYKDNVFTGWGISNNIAGVLMCAIPCAFYLASTKKNPVGYTLIATLIYLATIFTGSRNGVLIGSVIFVASAVFASLPRKNRRKNIITYFCVGISFLLFHILFPVLSVNLFDRWITHSVTSDARVSIYKAGWEQFISAPLFGKGFYACKAFAWGTETITFVPPRWHSTIIQILASCGTLGALAYGFHRYQTVKLFLERPTSERIFIALSLSALLLSSLVDCFLFNIGPGLFYSMMLAFLEKSDVCKPNEAFPLLRP